MNLVAIDIRSLPIGQPLPFALHSAKGVLLAPRGYRIGSPAELAAIEGRGVQVCVDIDEAAASHRNFMGQLQQMLRKDTPLGQIAAMKLRLATGSPRAAPGQGRQDWHELQQRASQLLHTPAQGRLVQRVQDMVLELEQLGQENADATLLALIYLSGQAPHQYSATHALLVASACMLTARQTLQWPAARVRTLGQAALTMNLAMTALQDTLALQTEPLTAGQLQQIQAHAQASRALLAECGVDDPLWLQAVALHHQPPTGAALAAQAPGEQMARLIQRADVFGARIAPRATRHAMPVTAAVQAIYYDERRAVDEAGAALLRTLGVYPPGAFVRLASDEVAVVLRRGASATTPRVAVVLGRSGMPTGEPIPRDSAQEAHRIVASLAPHELRLQVALERLLKLP
ncbi:HD-GYP domain-containing protein [Comamonas flocculans]|uniref:Phosphohydrolase n=1 Tax=Comamonas flocculans TaxID=2597701 RepID=A0A5B8RTB8_9BURK|nr:phosphohydrolase [Comamonas flocculans]QEA12731.1 phosphohydrolase [Comamonas flocculans]